MLNSTDSTINSNFFVCYCVSVCSNHTQTYTPPPPPNKCPPQNWNSVSLSWRGRSIFTCPLPALDIGHWTGLERSTSWGHGWPRWTAVVMDQITIKTPNPNCRLYWCLIEFVDWRYSQSCWYFRPLLWTSALHWLTFPPPLPCVNKWMGSGCVESIYRSYTLSIWPDSKPTKLLHQPKQILGGEKTSDR